MAHAHDEPEVGDEIEPVGGRQARAWVLEAPVVVLTEPRDRGRARLGDVGDPRIVDCLREGGSPFKDQKGPEEEEFDNATSMSISARRST